MISVYALIILFTLLQFQRVTAFLFANDFSAYITEWQSLWHKIFPTGMFVHYHTGFTSDIAAYLIFLACFIFFAAKKYKNSGKQFPLLATFFYGLFLLLPFKYYRLIVPVIIVELPFLISLIIQTNRKHQLHVGYLASANLFLLLIILFSTVLGRQLGGELREDIFPESATQFIAKNLMVKRAFTLGAWHDYLFWHLPHVKTFSDVQTQFRTLQDLQEESKLHSPEQDIAELLKKYDIDTVINTQPMSEVISGGSLTPVYALPGWRLVFVDGWSAVYARTDVIKGDLVDLSVLHPEFTTPNKYKLEEESKAIEQLEQLLQQNNENDFARSQLLFYYFVRQQDMAKATSLAEESREINPENPFYSFILAAVYLKQHDCKKVYEYATESLAKNTYDAELRAASNDLLSKCSGVLP